MEFGEAKDLVLTALVGGTVVYFGAQMKELVKSVTELNIKMSVILENIAYHKERIDEHSARLVTLENKR